MDKRNPRWRPDRKKLIFRSSNGSLFSIGLAGGREVHFLRKFENVTAPSFSPDGKEIVLAKYRPDLKDDSDIWRISSDGSRSVLIAGGSGLQYDPAWSPGGEKLLYVSGLGKGGHNILMLELSGGKKMQLTHNEKYNVAPTWSPDGSEIAYVSNEDGTYHIWIMYPDGKNKHRLTDSQFLEMEPCWSSDGKEIIYSIFVGGKWEIRSCDLEAGETRSLIREDTDIQDPVLFRQ